MELNPNPSFFTGSDALVCIPDLLGDFGVERNLHLQESTRDQE